MKPCLAVRIRSTAFVVALLVSIVGTRAQSSYSATNPAPVRIQTDVCIYGGTSAGIAAAIQVTRSGKRCVLVSPSKRLGGLTSNGLGWTDVGSAEAIGGFAREFYHEVYLHYAETSSWVSQSREAYLRQSSLRPDDQKQVMFTFEPKVAATIFHHLLNQASVKVIYARIKRPDGITKAGTRLQALVTEDGKTIVSAAQFIDASYEGDLLAEAGVSYTIGREGSAKYRESLAGIQTAHANKNQLAPGIDPYRVSGKADSGLLSGVRANAGGPDGTEDRRLQAYCYRMCLTDVVSNRVRVPKPSGYREDDFELLFRAIEAGQRQRFFKLSPMPNRKTDSNSDAGFSTDFIGGNYDLTADWNYADASYAKRESIDQAHRAFQLGLLWTLQNHARIPAEIRKAWSNWGLPLDEFTENEHWPLELYIREARRMISDFVITEHDVHQEPGHVASDSVGMGGYNLDSHHVQRYLTAKGFVQNEGDVQIAPRRGPYGISYRALTPRSAEAENLLAPVCLSASHVAFGSIRMEPVFMILGQSAGAAAVIAIDDRVSVQKVNYSKLSGELLKAGQVLQANPTRAAPAN
jgi:hypothetical protein